MPRSFAPEASGSLLQKLLLSFFPYIRAADHTISGSLSVDCGYGADRRVVRYKLVCAAVLTGGGSERDDLPSAVLFVEGEEISAAMIELAIDEEVERSPYDRQIVVDPNHWIEYSFLDVCGSRGRHAVGEVLNGDLAEASLHHQR